MYIQNQFRLINLSEVVFINTSDYLKYCKDQIYNQVQSNFFVCSCKMFFFLQHESTLNLFVVNS